MAAGIEDFLDLRGPEAVDRAFVCGDVQVREGCREPVVVYGQYVWWDACGSNSRREDGFVYTASIRSAAGLVSVEDHGA
jgi:hypothetical protein